MISTESTERTKLIYVLPSYQRQTSEHLAHNYELLETAGQYLDIFVVVEKGEAPTSIRNLAGHHVMRHQAAGLSLGKVLEFARVAAQLRYKGYRRLYAHYSNLGAIVGSALLRPLGGQTFYWHCYYDWGAIRSDDFQRSSGRRLTNLALRLVSYYVAGTCTTGQAYAHGFQFNQNKIVILPNWVDGNRFVKSVEAGRQVRKELAIPADAPVVLYVHRLEKSKGVSALPIIAQEVLQALPETLFVVAGDGSLRAQLEAELERRGLVDHFRLTGNVTNDRLPALYSAADLFIMPSTIECFPHVVLEAMATQTPQIVTEVGGVREILPEIYRPFVVPVDDWTAFAQKIVQLIRDPAFASTLSEAGYARFRQCYALDVVVGRFVEMVTGS